MEYKGVGIRFVAQIVDGIIFFVFFFIVGSIIAGSAGGATENGFELHGGPAFLLMFLETAFIVGYFTLLEAKWNGQSLGKKVVGIQVVREDGLPIDLNAALIRNILRIVDGFAFYLVAAIFVWTSDRKQRLGDRIAHTVVVKRR
ncbi:MAG: RDD family protein [Gammaproteobacteria bacterium]